jgi:hypothetical protein
MMRSRGFVVLVGVVSSNHLKMKGSRSMTEW